MARGNKDGYAEDGFSLAKAALVACLGAASAAWAANSAPVASPDSYTANEDTT